MISFQSDICGWVASVIVNATSKKRPFVFAMTLLLSGIALTVALTPEVSAMSDGCEIDLLDSKYDLKVSGNNLNQKLFNSAVLHYVNTERCNHGLGLLRSDNGLIRAAGQHSAHMAANAYVSHKSRQAGYRNLQDRLSKAQVKYRVAGENVVKSFVFHFNKQNVIRNSSNCSFVYANNGSMVPRHTYKTLARDLVKLWMDSPSHRSNILHRGFNRAGSTFGINLSPGFCGTVYAAQNFSN